MRIYSKTLTAWLAVLLGALGLHRFYLHGFKDLWGWLHWPFALLGAAGVQRMRAFGQDDGWAWALTPLLGLAISAGMLAAIVYALMPDERWHARYNAKVQPGALRPSDQTSAASGWGAVLAAIVALMLGGVVLLGTIAFGFQKLFEWQAMPTISQTQPAAIKGSR